MTALQTFRNQITASNSVANAATTVVSVSLGGTGAVTPAGARSNLGAAASGSNSDITSLSGLTSISGSASASFGIVLGTSAAFTGAITAGSVAAGAISGTTGAFSGAVSGSTLAGDGSAGVSVLPSITGGLSRSLAARSADTVSFADFGAIPGSTPAAIAATDAALASMIASATGRTVIVSTGTYRFSISRTIPASIRLQYEAGAVIGAAASSGAVLTMGGTTFRLGGGRSLSDGGAARGTTGIEVYDYGDATVGSSQGQFDKNFVGILSDQIDATSGAARFINGFSVEHHFGGGNATGGRQAIQGNLIQDAITLSRSTTRDYVGVTGTVSSSIGDGGSAGNYRGQYFGLNGYSVLLSGAMYALNATGGEFNVGIRTGASAQYRSGVQIAGVGDVQGDTYDAGVSISNTGAATVGWRSAILIGAQNGRAAIDSGVTGTSVIRLRDVATVERGFDFLNTAFSGFILQTPTTKLTENNLTFNAANANIMLGALTTASTPYIDFKSSGVTTSYDARLIASGGSATNGVGTLQAIAQNFVTNLSRPSADNTYATGAPTFRWSNVYATQLRPGAGTAVWTSGAGTPLGNVSAPVGSLYTRTDGGAGTTLYVKESGSDASGWVAK